MKQRMRQRANVRRFQFLLMACILAWGPQLFAQSIRLRIHSGSKPVEVSGQDLMIEEKKISNFKVERLDVGEQELWRLTDSSSKIIRSLPTQSFEVRGKNLKINGKPFPSPLTFLSGAKDKINVVVTLPLEDYVTGVVAGEMPTSWPIEALKAQSVASRSYVLAQLASQGKQLFDTDSSQFNQVFKWIGETPPSEIARVREAVQSTRGTVLRDKSGEVLWAYYHADCGGHTEEPNAVWSNHQFFGTVKDQCADSASSKWQADMSLELLNQKLSSALDAKEKIVEVKVGETTPSGRVKNMIVKLSSGGIQKIRSNQFRQQMGFGWVKSTLFEMSQKGSNYHLTGQGFGHGVGLCQRGSRDLAKQGKNFVTILKNYYPAARIETGNSLP